MSAFRYTRPDSFPPIVKNLIIINVIVYVAQIALENQLHLTDLFTLFPVAPEKLREIALQYNLIGEEQHFKPYQIITHMFTHAPPPMFFHILFNMLMLWMFGRVLENVWGPKRFLSFYFICGIGAAIAHLTMQYIRCEQLLQHIEATQIVDGDQIRGVFSGAIGASGAIMGVMVGFAYLFPNTELYIMFIPIPVKAKWAILGLVALDLFGGFGAQGDNIAHFAHLGGAITGFIVVYIWNKTNRQKFY